MTTQQPANHCPDRGDARRLDPDVGPDNGWGQYWAEVGNEAWQAARRLLDLSPRVAGFYANHLEVVPVVRYDDDGDIRADLGDELVLDWEAAADQIAADGFSSTEARLARLVAALTTGAPFPLADLGWMNDWTTDVLAVLVRWASDDRLSVTAAGERP